MTIIATLSLRKFYWNSIQRKIRNLQLTCLDHTLKRSLDDQYYCIIILYNIIDISFKQCKANAQYSLQAIDNIVEYQILINRIDCLGTAFIRWYYFGLVKLFQFFFGRCTEYTIQNIENM